MVRKLDILTSYIHKFVMKDPSNHVILIEVICGSGKKRRVIQDYNTTWVGDYLIFDSIKRLDEEDHYSHNFEFLKSLNRDSVRGKYVVNKNNLNIDNVHRALNRLTRDLPYKYEDVVLNIYFCDDERSKIVKKLVFDIISNDDRILILVDDLGETEKIYLGGNDDR